ncbi:unnamed protein product [Euphydryas editha]|uniref:Uncharacterized protein n=1 Tax=Euphydryas editha TaxID=104508 RepID=A0AAU9V803_EUPED|nr:unnamed protein product [Euphydryas editha]
MSYDCPLKLYNTLRQLFVNIYNDSYKTQLTRTSDRNKRWVTDKLKHMITERDGLFTLWSYDPKNMVKRLAYTKDRNKCKKLINNCNNDFVKQSIINCNKNIRKIWEKINVILGKEKKSLNSIILNNMSNQGDAENICNGFAATFDEEIQRIQHVCNVKLLKRNDYVKQPDRCMRWQPVSNQYVDKMIKSMNSHKSTGSGGYSIGK